MPLGGGWLHAQAPVRRYDLPPTEVSYHFEGTVVWQQPDGTVRRGVASIGYTVSPYTLGQPNSILVGGEFQFGEAGTPNYYAYLFKGKMDPNGRGVMRCKGGGEGASPSQPTLDPGKVPVLRTHNQQVLSGGVLAPDGTQLIFRADFVIAGGPT